MKIRYCGLLTLMLILTACGVSQEDYDTAIQERDEAVQAQEDLEDTISALETENADQADSIAQLEIEKQSLEDTIMEITSSEEASNEEASSEEIDLKELGINYTPQVEGLTDEERAELEETKSTFNIASFELPEDWTLVAELADEYSYTAGYSSSSPLLTFVYQSVKAPESIYSKDMSDADYASASLEHYATAIGLDVSQTSDVNFAGINYKMVEGRDSIGDFYYVYLTVSGSDIHVFDFSPFGENINEDEVKNLIEDVLNSVQL